MPSEPTGAIADRYAGALFDLAEDNGALDQVASDLKTLKAILGESRDFQRLIASPVISRHDQSAGIRAVAEKAGFSSITVKFLGVAAYNRRLSALSGVIESYLAKLAAKRNEIKAEVASAVQLSETQMNALIAALKQAMGSDVSLEVKIDPSLLGGMVVKVGSRMIDSSLKTKLQHLQLAMKGVG